MDLWYLVRFGIFLLITILIETPILVVGLSRRHSLSRRLFAGVWLNTCSYPIVFFVLPQMFDLQEDHTRFLLVAEIFAPLSECLLFWLAFLQGREDKEGKWANVRDMAVIILANLASFGIGEVMHEMGWFEMLLPSSGY